MSMIHLEKISQTGALACALVQGDGNAISRRASPELYGHGVIHTMREGGQRK